MLHVCVSFTILAFPMMTCRNSSGKVLAHIIIDDPKLRSYSEIGRKAFGPSSGPWISAIFCLELFTVRYVSVLISKIHSLTLSQCCISHTLR